MAKIITIIGKIYLCLAIGVISLGYASIWYFEGFGKLQEILSPFNIINFGAVIVTILPGYGLIKLGERLAAKR